MASKEAVERAAEIYDREFGNMPMIAEKISMDTTLTRNKAKDLFRSAIVDFIADILEDYEAE